MMAAVPPAERGDDLVPLAQLAKTFAARGRLRKEVEQHLGPPHHRVSADLWVYWGCESSDPEYIARGYNTMLIVFSNGRVSSLRVAPRSEVEALIARVEAAKVAKAQRTVAAKPAK